MPGESRTAREEDEGAFLDVVERAQLLDYLPVGVMVHGPDSRVLLSNPRATRLMGSSTPIVGRMAADPAWRFLRRDGSPMPVEEYPAMRVIATGQPVWRQVVGIGGSAEGGIVWSLVSALPQDDESGRLQRILVTFVDITDRQRLEEELTLRNLILSTQQETSLDGILVVDERGEIIFYNRRFAHLWGIPSETLAQGSDRSALDYARHLLKDPEEFMERVKYLYAHREESSRDEIALKDGRTFDRYSASMFGEDGRHYGRVWYFRDITERKQLEEQFRHAQKMEAIGRLAGGVAHDFNNILTAILGCAEFLLREIPLGDTRRHNAENIRWAGLRAESLIRQLLAFSRKQVLQPQALDLNEVVSGLEKMIRRLIGEDINLHIRLSADPTPVKADMGQLEQVVMNLAVNARDAMPHGGNLIVETSNAILDAEFVADHLGALPGPHARLSVSDDGVGIDASIMPHLFEPFFTTKEQGKGTGLGLATVYGIVKQSGGSVWVTSESGQGARFEIYLPSTDESPVSTAVVAPDELPRGAETVLLAEDDETVREIGRETLELDGYKVLVASDGREALERAAAYAGEIHILVTDVVMPRMGGVDLAAQLAALRPGIRTLFVSGYPFGALGEDRIIDAENFFLAKPFTPSDLARKVRQVLDSR